jgi:hypothetical protein
MFPGVEDIRDLYRLKQARLEVWEETLPLDQQPAACAEPHRALKTKLSALQARCEAHLHEPDLHVAKQTVLSSLHNPWDGLTVFAGCPAVAMEKNTAARSVRPPVVGRKNY